MTYKDYAMALGAFAILSTGIFLGASTVHSWQPKPGECIAKPAVTDCPGAEAARMAGSTDPCTEK